MRDVYLVLVNIEFNVIEKVKKGKLLGKEDDVDLLVAALTSKKWLIQYQKDYIGNKIVTGSGAYISMYEELIKCYQGAE